MSKSKRLERASVDGASAYACQRLRQKLAPELAYRNLTPTFEHVLPTAMELVDLCHVFEENRALLAVAIAFHDSWISW